MITWTWPISFSLIFWEITHYSHMHDPSTSTVPKYAQSLNFYELITKKGFFPCAIPINYKTYYKLDLCVKIISPKFAPKHNITGTGIIDPRLQLVCTVSRYTLTLGLGNSLQIALMSDVIACCMYVCVYVE